MRTISKLQAKGVEARLQRQRRGELAAAKVKVAVVEGDDLLRRHKIGVDENVEMACALHDLTGRLHRQTVSDHGNREGRRHGRAGLRLDKAHAWDDIYRVR